jgi:hypothetical protein
MDQHWMLFLGAKQELKRKGSLLKLPAAASSQQRCDNLDAPRFDTSHRVNIRATGDEKADFAEVLRQELDQKSGSFRGSSDSTDTFGKNENGLT